MYYAAGGVSSDKIIKVLGVCLSLPSPLLSLFSDSALAQSHRGILVTLTDTKQDTALRQDRRGPGCPISVSRLLLLSGVSLAFSERHQSAAL